MFVSAWSYTSFSQNSSCEWTFAENVEQRLALAEAFSEQAVRACTKQQFQGSGDLGRYALSVETRVFRYESRQAVNT